jgi:hypothetical protein
MFVKLVGELLGRLGFVDVDYQGDGPEGGIDLFATELLPFTVQGRTPFRWAIQCKFSSDPKNKSVNDREVQDVEGILRSDRYSSQNARGYLLVTNRQIVQNVVERLRGIDRQSQYRTARLDGGQLESMLADHPEIGQRYFDLPAKLGLSRPVLIVPRNVTDEAGEGFHLTVEVEARFPQNGKTARVRAMLDTGASMSVVSKKIIESIGASPTDSISMQSVTGLVKVPVYVVDLTVEQIRISQIRVIAVEGVDFALLGRDVLDRYSVVFDRSGTVMLFDSAIAPALLTGSIEGSSKTDQNRQ